MRGDDGTPQSRIRFLATVCTNCGLIGMAHQAGSDCAYCDRGVYLHQGYFDLNLCPECLGKGFGCKTCYAKGVLGTPREDMTQGQAAVIWAELEAAKVRLRAAIPEQELKHEWKAKWRRRKGRFARL